MCRHLHSLMILGYFTVQLLAAGENMMDGTELVGDPYDEAVYIQQKPGTTICNGIVVDEVTVYTSFLCEIGTLSIDNYHVVIAPHYETPPPSDVHNIKSVQRGKRFPFDLKVIKLKDPFDFSKYSNVTNVLWVETIDDYNDQFDLDPQRPGVVLGFGPPYKGGVVSYKINTDNNCRWDYRTVKETHWPGEMPSGGFCVYKGPGRINVTVPYDPKPFTVAPAVPGDDSIGSLVKLEAGYERTLGIVIKAFYGTKNVTIGWGSYYLLNPPFDPDPNWHPPPTTTSLTTTSTATPSTTTETTTTSTETVTSTTHNTPSTTGMTHSTTEMNSPRSDYYCFLIVLLWLLSKS